MHARVRLGSYSLARQLFKSGGCKIPSTVRIKSCVRWWLSTYYVQTTHTQLTQHTHTHTHTHPCAHLDPPAADRAPFSNTYSFLPWLSAPPLGLPGRSQKSVLNRCPKRVRPKVGFAFAIVPAQTRASQPALGVFDHCVCTALFAGLAGFPFDATKMFALRGVGFGLRAPIDRCRLRHATPSTHTQHTHTHTHTHNTHTQLKRHNYSRESALPLHYGALRSAIQFLCETMSMTTCVLFFFCTKCRISCRAARPREWNAPLGGKWWY